MQPQGNPRVPPQGNGDNRAYLRDIQRPIISASPSCIVLSAAARNYDLKTLQFNMIPHFHALPSEDALAFMREFCSVIATFPLNGVPELEL